MYFNIRNRIEYLHCPRSKLFILVPQSYQFRDDDFEFNFESYKF